MIRLATPNDTLAISRLLTQLDYPGTDAFLERHLQEMLSDPREIPLVWADHDTITGFLSMDFSIYPSLRGPVATMKAFAVDQNARSRGIGARLEAEATRLATEKGCDRIIVHCHTRRNRAHEFYGRQGYVESPKYLVKMLP